MLVNNLHKVDKELGSVTINFLPDNKLYRRAILYSTERSLECHTRTRKP